MDYSFNGEIAEKYGIAEAIFVHNIYWWIAKNEANGRHFYDGRTWTYNSMTAFSKLLPFFTEKQVRRVIQKLLDDGALYIGNYNSDKRDRTQWYALSEDVLSYYKLPKREDCKCPDGQMTSAQTGKCIYRTDSKQADSNYNTQTRMREENESDLKEDFSSTGKELILYPRISEIAKKHAPTIWKRTEDRISQNGTALVGRIEGIVESAGFIQTEQDLIDLLAHAEKTCYAKPAYEACDVYWVINNHRKVKAAKEDVIESFAPKQADKPKGGYTPDYSEYNARFKV